MKKPPVAKLLIVLLMPLLSTPQSSVAADYTWNIPGSGAWDFSPNWSPIGVPSATDDTATFGSGIPSDATISRFGPTGTFIVKQLTINPGSSFNYTFASGLNHSFQTTSGGTILNVSGNNTFNGGITVQANSSALTLDSQAGTLSFNGSITLNNNFINLGTTSGGGSGDIVLGGGLTTPSISILSKYGSGTATLNGTTAGIGVAIFGGKFVLGAANRISDSAQMFLGMGTTFATGGFSETVGTLQLGPQTPGATVATIDLGNGASILKFSGANSWYSDGILSIANWSGSPSGGGTDQIFVGTSSSSLTPAQLAQVFFKNPDGWAAGDYMAGILSNGELVPVPEPGAIGLAVGVGLLGFGVFRRIRKRSAS